MTCLALLMAVVIFGGCGNDDDDKGGSGVFDRKITAQVENGSNYNSLIKSVKAISRYGDDGENEYVHVQGSYSNGSFTLTLPQTVNNLYLWNIEKEFQSAEINNKSANIMILRQFFCYNSNDEFVGWIYQQKEATSSHIRLIYIYVDRDVTVSGSIYNMTLKKGWNKVYDTYSSGTNTGCTTEEVSGLKWYFEQVG